MTTSRVRALSIAWALMLAGLGMSSIGNWWTKSFGSNVDTPLT